MRSSTLPQRSARLIELMLHHTIPLLAQSGHREAFD